MGDEKDKKAAKPEEQKDAPAAATPPADLDKEKEKKLQSWYEKLPEDLKFVGETMLIYAKSGKDKIQKVDFNNDGTPDFTQMVNAAVTGKDVLVGAATTLKDKGVALWDDGAPKVGEFLGDNKFGLMGGLLGALLMIGLFEMGPIAGLLMGLLLFSAISAMGGDQFGLFSGNKKPDPHQGQQQQPSQGAGQSLQQGADGPERGDTLARIPAKEGERSASHLDFALRQDGTLVAQGSPAAFAAAENSETNMIVSGNFVGEGANRKFEVSHVAARQADGKFARGNNGALSMTDISDRHLQFRTDERGNVNIDSGGFHRMWKAAEPARTASAAAVPVAAPETAASAPAALTPDLGPEKLRISSHVPVVTFMVNTHGRPTNNVNDAVGAIQGTLTGDLFTIERSAVKSENGRFINAADGSFNFREIPLREGYPPEWAQFNIKGNEIDFTQDNVQQAVKKSLGRAEVAYSMETAQIHADERRAEAERTARQQREERERAARLEKQELEKTRALKISPEFKKIDSYDQDDGMAIVTYEYKHVGKNDKVRTDTLFGKNKDGEIAIEAVRAENSAHTKPVVPPIKTRSTLTPEFHNKLNNAIEKIDATENAERKARQEAAKDASTKRVQEFVGKVHTEVENTQAFISNLSQTLLGGKKKDHSPS